MFLRFSALSIACLIILSCAEEQTTPSPHSPPTKGSEKAPKEPPPNTAPLKAAGSKPSLATKLEEIIGDTKGDEVLIESVGNDPFFNDMYDELDELLPPPVSNTGYNHGLEVEIDTKMDGMTKEMMQEDGMKELKMSLEQVQQHFGDLNYEKLRQMEFLQLMRSFEGKQSLNIFSKEVDGPKIDVDAVFNETISKSLQLFEENPSSQELERREKIIFDSMMQLAKSGDSRAMMSLASRFQHDLNRCDLAFNTYAFAADRVMKELEQLNDGRDIPLDLEGMRLANWEIDGFLGDDFEDAAELIEYDKLAAEQGDTFAQKEIGWRSLVGKGVEQDHGAALGQFEAAANIGDVEAMHNLGYMYLNGLGVPKDVKKAAEYFKTAAAGNITQANNALGYIYMRGEGVQQNLTAAEFYFEKAIADGDPDSHYNLALLIEQRDRNLTKIASHFAAAASYFHWRSMIAWSELQFRGSGTNVSCSGAVKTIRSFLDRYGAVPDALRAAVDLFKTDQFNESFWIFASLAEQGVEVAQSNAAFLLRKKYVVLDASSKLAFRLSSHASQQGSIDDTYQIGNMYLHGVGVFKNVTKGIELLKAAAANRSSSASLALGHLHEWGIHVPKNFTQALSYYEASSSHHSVQYAATKLPSLLAVWCLSAHAFSEPILQATGLGWVLQDPTTAAACLFSAFISFFILLLTMYWQLSM